ncbi:MAG: TIGR03087 family PEP-CTERM/XrtA system glycosyltransferase [Desulfosoma sp.]
MRILYLAHRIPYPPNKGDKIRSYHEVRYLAQCHEVDLGCLCDDPQDMKHVETLRTWCRSVQAVPLTPWKARLKCLLQLPGSMPLSVSYFYSPRLQRWVDECLESRTYDAVLCFSSPMAEYVFSSRHKKTLWQPGGKVRKIIDFCDLDSDKWAQYAKRSPVPFRWVYKEESRRLWAYERKVHESFDVSIFVSEAERELFLRKSPGALCPWVVGNGVDTDFFCPLDEGGPETTWKKGEPTIVFVGAMDYHANVDGVLWFAKTVWPRIRQRFPRARFTVVGSRPHPRIRRLSGSYGIHVTGFVPDVRPYLRSAVCVVAPLRMARGVQNKVLEAMATGKAVVATSQALDGLKAVPDRDILCADGAEAFAQAVIDIVENPEKRRHLEYNARDYVLKHHSWKHEMAKLEALVSRASHHTMSSRPS